MLLHVRRAFTQLWTISPLCPLSSRLCSGIPPFSPSTTGQNHLGSVTFTENGPRIRLKSCSAGPALSLFLFLSHTECHCCHRWLHRISSQKSLNAKSVLMSSGHSDFFPFSGPGDFTRSHTIQKKLTSWLLFFFISTCYWHNSMARSVFQSGTTLGPVLSQRLDGFQLSFVQSLSSCRGWILTTLIPRPLL